jgi:hypothetical protein
MSYISSALQKYVKAFETGDFDAMGEVLNDDTPPEVGDAIWRWHEEHIEDEPISERTKRRLQEIVDQYCPRA